MTVPTINSRHYLAIFCVALATIAFQILITRIFSVTLSYHFAFAGITFVMIGITAGALNVFMKQDKYSAANAETEIALNLCFFSVFICACILLFISSPSISAVLHTPLGPTMALCFVLSVAVLPFPFIFGGTCIAIFLTRFPAHTSRLYAFDLCGAALGCIAVIAALRFMNPISVMLMLAWILIVVAWRLLPKISAIKSKRIVQGCFGLMSTLIAMQITTSYLHERPLFHLQWTKRYLVEQFIFERWNTYSYISVRNSDDMVPFGWGFSVPHTQQIEQKQLTIDADAGTVLTSFDGDLGKVSYLKDDVINLGYQVRSPDNVAVIGVGGGRDILSGLVFGAKHITGIEINPAIFEALTSVFGDFTGHLDTYPGVKLVNAEARSFLNSNPARYDFIQVSLIDTWAATAEGSLTLTENKLYTTDAWSDFLDRLDDLGVLSVSRWFNQETHLGEFYRLLSIAQEVLQTKNNKDDVSQHLMAALSNNIVTVLVSKSPFSEEEIDRFYATCKKLNFKPLLSPRENFDAVTDAILHHKNPQILEDLPINISASTDDKPFFFNMIKAKTLFGKNAIQTTVNPVITINNNFAVIVLAFMVLVTSCTALVFIGIPLFVIWKKGTIKLSAHIPNIIFFSGIGLGFMLVEISHMQRLMIFLGHPVYGLSVALFTLLLFSGLGSSTVNAANISKKSALLRPALLCVTLVITGLLTPVVTEYVKYYDVPVRIIASILLLAPMGFFMGMMFPLGMALNKNQQSDLLPWFWGINGAASIFASTFSMALSMQSGITFTFWTGVTCYFICLIVVRILARSPRLAA